MNRATLHSIARRLRVSHATVSMALHNNPRIKEKTRLRIQKYAEKVGYRANRLAQGLKTSSSKLIGCVLPTLGEPYYARIAEYLYYHALKNGYQVQFVLSQTQIDQEINAIHECMDSRVDGMVIYTSLTQEEQLERHPLVELSKTKFPVAMLSQNSIAQRFKFPSVEFDTPQATFDLANHLIEQNYKKLYLFHFGNPKHRAFNLRVSGLKRALQKHGMSYDESMVLSSTPGLPGSDVKKSEVHDGSEILPLGYQMAESVLSHVTTRTGLICTNDYIAASVHRYCEDKKIDVPKTLGIAGYDNTVSPFLNMTSIQWDYSAFAQKTIEGLIGQIKKKPFESKNVIPGEIVIRGTTR